MESAGLTAVMSAVIMALVKTIEWLIKKYNERNGKPTSAGLSEEQQRQIRETYESMKMVMRDVDEIKKTDEKFAAVLSDIAACLRRTSETQEKIVDMIDRIDRRQEIDHEISKRSKLLSMNGAGE